MRITQAFIISFFLIQVSCRPLPGVNGTQGISYVPDYNLLGRPTVSDEKAARLEQIRIQKAIYWPERPVTRLESTNIQGIFAYYDQNPQPILVDETFSFAKFGTQPWIVLDETPNNNATEQQEDFFTQKAIRAWIDSKDTFAIKFGTGRKRHFIYIAAPDCPVSQKFDDIIKSATEELDVTLYTRLISIGNSMQSNNIIQNTICAKDPANEWFRVRGGKPSKTNRCSTLPWKEKEQLIMSYSLPIRVVTPMLLSEDGENVNLSSVLGATSPGQAKSALKLIFDASTKPGKNLFPE